MAVASPTRFGAQRRTGAQPLPAGESIREVLTQRKAARDGTAIGFLDWAMKVPEPKAGPLNFDAFPFQRELYREGVHDKEACVMKATQVGMCLGPDTKVLMADLRWARIDSLQSGDRVIGCDEESRAGSGSRRRMREATVTKTWTTRREALRITLDDGREVVCSREHRWLTKHRGYVAWREARELTVGRSLRHVTETWGEPSYEDGWMAGILDGEGYIRARGTKREIVITQQPGGVLDRIVAYLNDRGYIFGQRLEPRPNGKPVAKIALTRTSDVMRLIGQTRPTRLKGGWDDGASLPADGRSWPKIVAIEPVGKRDLIDIETTTGTFLANGVVSHNSAYSTRWALYHADTRGRTGLYVFPTQRDMWDFSSLRIKPMIAGSPYLKARNRPDDPDNKGMKGVGLGIVVFRGSESKTGLDSVDCDHIVFDEYDTLDHANIPDAEMRVSSPLSPGLIRRIGVPSVPDWGIHQIYQESDRRRWMVKCHHCNEWQTLDFFENVDLTTATRVCAKCHKSIEEDIGNGQWVAEFPDQQRPRGYHVTRLIAPGASMKTVIEKSRKRGPSERTVFFNKHLGVPYVAEESRLSKEAIAAAQSRGEGYVMAPGYTGANLVTMGIDVATVRELSVRISEHIDDERKRALWIGEVERFFEYEPGEGPSLEGLMNRFGVHMAAIDHEPDGRMARSFAEKFRGRVYVVAYSGTTTQPEVLKVDDDMMTATVKRTQAIDATFELVRQQKNLLPLNLPDGYVEQMQALVRVVEEDEVGKKKVVYRKMGNADDYAHAEVYDLVASELWLHRQMKAHLLQTEDVNVDDLIPGFEHSRLADYADPSDYYAGGGEDDDYYAGGGE